MVSPCGGSDRGDLFSSAQHAGGFVITPSGFSSVSFSGKAVFLTGHCSSGTGLFLYIFSLSLQAEQSVHVNLSPCQWAELYTPGSSGGFGGLLTFVHFSAIWLLPRYSSGAGTKQAYSPSAQEP